MVVLIIVHPKYTLSIHVHRCTLCKQTADTVIHVTDNISQAVIKQKIESMSILECQLKNIASPID
uniref:Uncharacterized protein n=1 Tax=Arion vulgaris TaxID=1028688 RepID=A0A0B7A5L3_9EUPU